MGNNINNRRKKAALLFVRLDQLLDKKERKRSIFSVVSPRIIDVVRNCHMCRCDFTVSVTWLHFPGAHIQFQNFSSEDNHDFLEVRAGPQHSSSLIGQFTGSQIPPSLLSTTHLTIIHFYSDHSENRQGFKLTYQGRIYLFLVFLFFLYMNSGFISSLETLNATCPEESLQAISV